MVRDWLSVCFVPNLVPLCPMSPKDDGPLPTGAANGLLPQQQKGRCRVLVRVLAIGLAGVWAQRSRTRGDRQRRFVVRGARCMGSSRIHQCCTTHGLPRTKGRAETKWPWPWGCGAAVPCPKRPAAARTMPGTVRIGPVSQLLVVGLAQSSASPLPTFRDG